MSGLFLDAGLLDRLVGEARAALRLRAHHKLHADLSAPAHRLLVAMEPDSYVRPHCHLDPAKAETIIVLRGRLGTLIFNDDGSLREVCEMTPGGAVIGFDVPPGVFHSIVALESGTVFVEIKAGPYAAPVEAEWGGWAPAEGQPGVPAYLASMRDSLAG